MSDDVGTPLEQRIDRLVARYRGSGHFASRQEVEDLYTEGCAEALTLESRCLRVERRLRERAGDDAEAQVLQGELGDLSARLDWVRRQVRHLRAAVDWAEEEHDLSGLLAED